MSLYHFRRLPKKLIPNGIDFSLILIIKIEVNIDSLWVMLMPNLMSEKTNKQIHFRRSFCTVLGSQEQVSIISDVLLDDVCCDFPSQVWFHSKTNLGNVRAPGIHIRLMLDCD